MLARRSIHQERYTTLTPHDNDTPHDGADQAPRPCLQFDPAKYTAEIDRFDITEVQKQELLLTLWSIMRSFVELGFTVDVCGALWDDPSPFPDDAEVS